MDVPRVYLARLTADGHLEKAGRGLYRLPDNPISEHEGLAAIGTKAPRAIFCLLAALQFHELTTQLPRPVWIAMPRGSHTPKIHYPPVKMLHLSGDAYARGVEIHKRDQVELRVYSVAKTIADCFKHRNKMELDVVLEALKDARTRKMVSADDLWNYAKVCRASPSRKVQISIRSWCALRWNACCTA